MNTIDLSKPNVVAVVSCKADLLLAIELTQNDADAVEIRADSPDLINLRLWLWRIKLPIILTVRDQSEGGLSILSTDERVQLFLGYLGFASLIDIELKLIHDPAFKQVIREARKRGVGIIGSYHDFKGVSSKKKLAELLRIALKFKCDVLKLAITLSNRGQITPLYRFMVPAGIKIPVALMSMGKLGMKTRPLFAWLGSVLNYGYIIKPSATGQWQVQALKKRIEQF